MRSFLLTYGFLLQAHALLYLVPYVGWLLHVICLSWYWSFFCFEYKWALHGWTVEQRIAAIEEQWLFLAGFGMPLALLSVAFSTFVSYGIVAFVFPLFVVLATISEPRAHPPSRWLPRRLPLFNLPKRLGLLVVRALSRHVKQPREAALRREAAAVAAPSHPAGDCRRDADSDDNDNDDAGQAAGAGPGSRRGRAHEE
jgi:hypothetical protein